MITYAGSGHIGTSFSSIDLVSWLFINELCSLSERDKDSLEGVYFSSKGHDVPALYSVLIGLGKLDFELIHKLRKLGGLPGHPDVSTPFIEANTGSLGMGISKAKGMVVSDRLAGRKRSIFVMTGDGELQEGQLWESLSSASNNKMDEITVIVDHNKLQSDTWVNSVNSLGDLEGKFRSFGWHVERCDGHDFYAIANVLNKTKAVIDRPKVIIADTIKGNGVSFMESTALTSDDEMYSYHSGAPSLEEYHLAIGELMAQVNSQLADLGVESLETETTISSNVALSHISKENLIEAYSRELVTFGAKYDNLLVLDADLMLDCGLIPFRNEFPERFVECGIAEQDMVSQAGAIALKGLLPIVNSFACFLSPRANEQIYNNATEKTKVIYMGALAGIVPAGPGHSHQSVRDISTLSAVPNLVLIEPSCELEVEMAIKYAVEESENSTYLRLGSIDYRKSFNLPPDYQFKLGQGTVLADGDSAVLFAYGLVMLTEAFDASVILKKKYGLRIRVVNLPWLNRIDDSWLVNQLIGVETVFTLDNHYVSGGQGEMLGARLSEIGSDKNIRLKRFGIRDVPACGTNDEVLKFHRMDANSLAEDILKFIQLKPEIPK